MAQSARFRNGSLMISFICPQMPQILSGMFRMVLVWDIPMPHMHCAIGSLKIAINSWVDKRNNFMKKKCFFF